MKRIYLTPDAVYMNIECETIIATSPAARISIDKGGQGGDEQLSNKQQGAWGNVWNK
ncbi:MAG: hypothetical protein IKL54_05180 [Bacteroidaceae bacterium]|nr:hypothetical protein [Bacteroidaceae bacterium]